MSPKSSSAKWKAMTHARGPDLHYGGLPPRVKGISIKRRTDMNRRRQRREPLGLDSKESCHFSPAMWPGGEQWWRWGRQTRHEEQRVPRQGGVNVHGFAGNNLCDNVHGRCQCQTVRGNAKVRLLRLFSNRKEPRLHPP